MNLDLALISLSSVYIMLGLALSVVNYYRRMAVRGTYARYRFTTLYIILALVECLSAFVGLLVDITTRDPMVGFWGAMFGMGVYDLWRATHTDDDHWFKRKWKSLKTKLKQLSARRKTLPAFGV